MGRARWVAPALVAVLAAGCVAGCAAAPPRPPVVRPSTPSPVPASPVANCIDPQEQEQFGVVAPAPGGDVVALVQGVGTTGVVFADMRDADLCQWWATATLLAVRGYRTAVFDYAAGDLAAQVVGVCAELRRRGVTRIELVGAAEGGTAVLVAARAAGAVAVAELSADASYAGMDAVAAAADLRIPLFLAVGEEDGSYPEDALAIYRASPSRTTHLEVVTSSAHGFHLFDRVDPLVMRFLAENAG